MWGRDGWQQARLFPPSRPERLLVWGHIPQALLQDTQVSCTFLSLGKCLGKVRTLSDLSRVAMSKASSDLSPLDPDRSGHPRSLLLVRACPLSHDRKYGFGQCPEGDTPSDPRQGTLRRCSGQASVSCTFPVFM